MPLTPEQKQWVLQQLNLDPNGYDLDEVNYRVTPKASSSQPAVFNTTTSPKPNPANIVSTSPDEPSMSSSFFTGALHSLGPSIGGGLGIGPGAAAGSALGTMVFPGVGTAVGGVLGGIAGGIGGSLLGRGAQELVEPESFKQQVATSEAANPWSTRLGGIATMPLGGFLPSPSNLVRAGGTLGKVLLRAPTDTGELANLANVGFGAGLGVAQPIGESLISGRPMPTPSDLATSALLGGGFNKPWALGHLYGIPQHPTITTEPNRGMFLSPAQMEEANRTLAGAVGRTDVTPTPPETGIGPPTAMTPEDVLSRSMSSGFIKPSSYSTQERFIPSKSAEESAVAMKEAGILDYPETPSSLVTPREAAWEAANENLNEYQAKQLAAQRQKNEQINAMLDERNELERQALLKAKAEAAWREYPIARMQSGAKAKILRKTMGTKFGEEARPEPIVTTETGKEIYPDYTGIGEQAATEVAAESPADLEARRLEAQLSGEERPKYSEEAPLKAPERPITAGEQELIKEHKAGLPTTPNAGWYQFFKDVGVNLRNISLRADDTLALNNKPIAGVAFLRNKLGEALAKINPKESGAVTIPHEMIGHIFYNDLKESPRARDNMVARQLEKRVEESPDFARVNQERATKGMEPWNAEEYIANEVGAYAVKRAHTTESPFSKWLNDFKSYFKTRFTEHATQEDLTRLMTHKFYADPAFARVFGKGEGLTAPTTIPTTERKDVDATFAHTWPEQKLGETTIPARDYYTLNEDIPGHPKGSTVSEETVNKAGYNLPARTSEEAPIRQGGLPPHHPSIYAMLNGIANDWENLPRSSIKNLPDLKESMLHQINFDKVPAFKNAIQDADFTTEEGITDALVAYKKHVAPITRDLGDPDDVKYESNIGAAAPPLTKPKPAPKPIAKEAALKPKPVAKEVVEPVAKSPETTANLPEQVVTTKSKPEKTPPYYAGEEHTYKQEIKPLEIPPKEPLSAKDAKTRDILSKKEWREVDTTDRPRELAHKFVDEANQILSAERNRDYDTVEKQNNRLNDLKMKHYILTEKHGIENIPFPEGRYSTESILKRAREIIKPEIDKVADLDEPTAKPLAVGMTKFFENLRVNQGRFQNKVMGQLLQHINIRNPKELFTQNNKKLENVRDYLWDMQDNGRSNIILTPEEQRIRQYIEDNMADTLSATNALPFNNKRTTPSLFPNIIKRSAIDTLINAPSSPEFNALHRSWMNYYQTKLGKTPSESEKAFEALRKGFLSKYPSDTAKSFRAVDAANDLPLPRDWREPNLIDVMSRYNQRIGRRLAYKTSMEDDPVIQDALNNPKSGLSEQTNVKNVMEDIAGHREFNEATRSAALGVIRAGMLGTLTGAKDVISSQTLGMQHQTFSQLFPAKAAAWGNIINNIRDNFSEAYGAGILRHNISSLEMGDGGFTNLASILRRSRDIISSGQGRNFLEKVSRALTLDEGKFLAMNNFQKEVSGKGNATSKAFMDNFVDNASAHIFNGSLPNDVLQRAAAKYVESVQGAYDYRGLPAVAMKGSLAPYLALSRWNIEKLNNFNKHVVQPLRNGNPKPFLMATIGSILGGEAVNQLVQTVTGRKEKTPKYSEIAGLAEEGQPLTAPLLYKAAGLASMSGYAGLAGDLFKGIMDKIFHNRVQTYDNPLMSAIGNYGNTAGDIIEAAGKNELGPEDAINLADSVLGDTFQIYRLIQAHAGGETEQSIEHGNLLRDYKLFRTTHGLPVSEVTTDRPNPLIDENLKQFKRTGDISEAASMLPDLISEALKKSDGNPERLRTELKKIKENNYETMPSPEHMPLTFLNYLNYLRKTQGEDAASERMMDYMRQNAINRAKSQAVPSF